ncbi:ATP-dependent DNA helicase RecG [Rickettsiella endosymbiont of Litargus connexus]|jgi:ATP-dependent DNA helicase RecG|uniref:ATP-dependent DNA helicase RecG n=1 Tax=Rickettsiella endosymbiont of Litargus connexus TaxID=3066237 RepID=UPI00376EC2B5
MQNLGLKNPNVANKQTLAEISCTQLLGVGQKITGYLNKCGILNLQDLLLHLPLRYENRTQLTPIEALRSGTHALIAGVIQADSHRIKSRKGYSCNLSDETGCITLRFFHFKPKQSQQFKKGLRLLCFGEIRTKKNKFFELEMIHPDYEFLRSHNQLILPNYLTGIYPSTPGMSQRLWHKLITQVLHLLFTKAETKLIHKQQHYFPEYLPEDLLKRIQFPTLLEALYYIHRPPADAPLDELATGKHITQQRLALEELLAHSLSVQQMKKKRAAEIAPHLKADPALIKRFLTALPFQLTQAQKRVIKEINHDMQGVIPMQRLLQGDVGSGKTVVAAFATLIAIANHYQVALMAPTELLSEQHYQHFHRWLTPLGFHVVCLNAGLQGKVKKQILDEIKIGKAHIAIGTHALFQDGVHFENLGFIIVDEQHRFGVQQRLALWKKGQQENLQAHQLFMTATPIPRTLAMTSFTDLDISFLDELPPGRLPVQTIVLSDHRRSDVIERVRATCTQQKQVYWVCPLIEESDLQHYQAAETTFKALKADLTDLRLGLIHGRLPSAEKERIMRDFKKGEIDLLVATSVIEVGVDVSSANLIVIENAERLGLAQLHQLRGRVGRSDNKSFCILLYQTLSPLAKERLGIMRSSNDGFMIAQRDLELRGPGEIWGLRQTGWQQLRIADLKRDHDLIPHVLNLSTTLNSDYPHLIKPIIQRWAENNDGSYSKV